MKKWISAAAVIVFAAGGMTAQARHIRGGPQTRHHHRTVTKAVYTCSMHPEVRMHAPGKCPKCGMTLVRRK